ncbi:hypothetical protein [Curvibacter gracilis]|uniref:hypothetical protein n=1 Tax=Curvibacter gracilis TaxID=230310 RepID=UPI00047FF174|nr:hypothetical protein [Curvibacter gracilis]
MTPLQQLDALNARFDEFRQGRLPPHEFSRQARQFDTLLAALPPAFSEVQGQLLDRLESSALFSEESCSFSQQGLIDHLQVWIEKARSRLT